MKTIHNCDLTGFNSYNIPARCRVAYFPESVADIVCLFRNHLSDSSYVVLGSGNNIILAREHYETPFIIFNGNLAYIDVSGEIMTIGAGAFTKNVCEVALAHALSGFEMFYDIPSSIGGAIVMNAGTKDGEIADILETVTYLDVRTGRIATLPNEQAGFRYRNSIFQENSSKIVLSATFRLRKSDPVTIREQMEQSRAERWAKQPRDYPNAGSVFKRPAGRYVGPMLDELGLKGYSNGGFRVSLKHSGFIQKVGTGTGCDLLALIKDIQCRVYDRFEVNLEIEQRIIDAP